MATTIASARSGRASLLVCLVVSGVAGVATVARPPGETERPESPPRPAILDLSSTGRDGVFLARLTLDRAVLLDARLAGGAEAEASLPHWNDVACVAASPERNEVAICHVGGVVEFATCRESNSAAHEPRWTRLDVPWPASCRYSPDGSRFAVTDHSGLVIVLNPESLAEEFRNAPSEDGCSAVTFTPNARGFYLAQAGRLRHVDLTSRVERAIGACPRTAELLDTSPDGTSLAITHRNGVSVWDLDGERVRWSSEMRHPCRVAWSPDGRRLAICDRAMARGLAIHEAGSGRREGFVKLDPTVLDVDFSSDGRRLLLGCADGVLRSCDPGTRQLREVAAVPMDWRWRATIPTAVSLAE